MATLAQKLNSQFSTQRRANKGKASPGKQSGFATKSQKRADLVAAFGGD